VGERENHSCYLEEDSKQKVLFQTEGALAIGVSRDTGYVTRCPRGDGELLRGDPTDDCRPMPLVRGEEKRKEEEEKE
jgi:hypothetical protein